MREDSMWGLGVASGMVAVLFGIAAVFWPGLTLFILIYLFAAFILLSGIGELVGGMFHSGESGSWFLKVLLGVLLVGVGVYLLRHPHVSFKSLILLIGFTLIVRGVFNVVMAFLDEMSNGTRSMYTIVGLLAVISGIVVLFQPVSGGVAFVWVIGLYALIIGPVEIAAALKERRLIKAESKR